MTTETATQRHELEKRIPTPAPPYEPGKLAAFANVLHGLSMDSVEQTTFYNFFVGSVSLSVPAEQWEHSLKLAREDILKGRKL